MTEPVVHLRLLPDEPVQILAGSPRVDLLRDIATWGAVSRDDVGLFWCCFPWEDFRFLIRRQDGPTEVMGWQLEDFAEGADPIEDWIAAEVPSVERSLRSREAAPEGASEILALLAESVEEDLPVVVRAPLEQLQAGSGLEGSVAWARATLPVARRRDARITFGSAHPVSDLLERGVHMVVVGEDASPAEGRWREVRWLETGRIGGTPAAFRLLRSASVIAECHRRDPRGRRSFTQFLGIAEWAATSESALTLLWDLVQGTQLDLATLERLDEELGPELEGPRWEGILGDPGRTSSKKAFRRKAEEMVNRGEDLPRESWRAAFFSWLEAHLKANDKRPPLDEEIVFRQLDGAEAELRTLAAIPEVEQRHLVELIDERLRSEPDPSALLDTLIRAGIWGAWRRWTSLSEVELGARALEWMRSSVWRSSWPTYEDWRRAVEDLVADPGVSRERFLEAPEWPRIPLCGRRQERDLRGLSNQDASWWERRQRAERLWISMNRERIDPAPWIRTLGSEPWRRELFAFLIEEAEIPVGLERDPEGRWERWRRVADRHPALVEPDPGDHLAPILRLASALLPGLGPGQVAARVGRDFGRRRDASWWQALRDGLTELTDSEWNEAHSVALFERAAGAIFAPSRAPHLSATP